MLRLRVLGRLCSVPGHGPVAQTGLQRFASSCGTLDFRSDTVTLPSDAVRAGAASAVVGDDVYGEDATVHGLEERVAKLLGKEAGLFVPSATMGNLVALAASNPRRGSSVLLGQGAHILRWELEGVSSLLGQPLR